MTIACSHLLSCQLELTIRRGKSNLLAQVDKPDILNDSGKILQSVSNQLAGARSVAVQTYQVQISKLVDVSLRKKEKLEWLRLNKL